QKRFTLSMRVPVPAIFSQRDQANQVRRNGQLLPLPANLTNLGPLLSYEQIADGICGINFGSNDSELATLDLDGVVRLWSPESGQQLGVLGTIPDSTVFILGNRVQRPFDTGQLAFSPDGRQGIAVFRGRNPPVLWDLKAGKS